MPFQCSASPFLSDPAPIDSLRIASSPVLRTSDLFLLPSDRIISNPTLVCSRPFLFPASHGHSVASLHFAAPLRIQSCPIQSSPIQFDSGRLRLSSIRFRLGSSALDSIPMQYQSHPDLPYSFPVLAQPPPLRLESPRLKSITCPSYSDSSPGVSNPLHVMASPIHSISVRFSTRPIHLGSALIHLSTWLLFSVTVQRHSSAAPACFHPLRSGSAPCISIPAQPQSCLFYSYSNHFRSLPAPFDGRLFRFGSLLIQFMTHPTQRPSLLFGSESALPCSCAFPIYSLSQPIASFPIRYSASHIRCPSNLFFSYSDQV